VRTEGTLMRGFFQGAWEPCRRVSARVRSQPGHIQNCEYKEGLSDETKNRGPQSVYARASKRSHTGGQYRYPVVDSYLWQKSKRVTTLCNDMLTQNWHSPDEGLYSVTLL
jgi:hypothetical protein